MKHLFFFLLFCNVVNAQSDEFMGNLKIKADSNLAKDFHQRKALTVEELYYKTNPKAAVAHFGKSHYLVLEKLRTGKRKRFYEGDIFRFKTRNGKMYEEELVQIKDSSFLVAQVDLDHNFFKYKEIQIQDVKRIYKRPLRKGFRFGLNSALFYGVLEPVIDKIQFDIPIDGQKMLRRAVILGAFTLLGQNADKFFRSTRLTDNKRLRVFQAY